MAIDFVEPDAVADAAESSMPLGTHMFISVTIPTNQSITFIHKFIGAVFCSW